MSAAIITVLSNIPWGQVVENAPKVAEGAAKLWNAVTRKNSKQSSSANTQAFVSEPTSEMEILRTRLVALEEQVQSLQEQMLTSTELIKNLAEQNTQLVQRIERNTSRLSWLAVAILILSITIAYQFIWH